MATNSELRPPESERRRVLSELRPYRRRLIVLVVLAALGGALVGELAPRRSADSTKTKTVTAAPHGKPNSANVGLH
jgi:hypothetical protein